MPAIPAARIFDVLAPDTPVLWLVLPKISAELPLVVDGLAGTGGKTSPPLFCGVETLDTVRGLVFFMTTIRILDCLQRQSTEIQMPSNKPRISCRRFAVRNLCMGTSSPVGATPAEGSEALESTESSLLVRIPLDRIGARGLRGFGANLSASISPRAGNGALKTPEPSLLDRAGVRCARGLRRQILLAVSISPRDGKWSHGNSGILAVGTSRSALRTSLRTNLAIASGSLGTTLEGRPPAA